MGGKGPNGKWEFPFPIFSLWKSRMELVSTWYSSGAWMGIGTATREWMGMRIKPIPTDIIIMYDYAVSCGHFAARLKKKLFLENGFSFLSFSKVLMYEERTRNYDP